MNIKVSASTLNNFLYLKEILNSENYLSKNYKHDKIKDFIYKTLGYESQETPYTKRGKEFEKLVNEGKIDIIEENFSFSKAQQQVYVEKKYLTLNIEEEKYNFYMVGFIDYIKNGEIFDLKRKNQEKINEFLNDRNLQTAFYTDVLNKNVIHYVCGYSKNLETVPFNIKYALHTVKIKNKQENLNIIENNIKDFITFLRQVDLFKYYVKFNNYDEFKYKLEKEEKQKEKGVCL